MKQPWAQRFACKAGSQAERARQGFEEDLVPSDDLLNAAPAIKRRPEATSGAQRRRYTTKAPSGRGVCPP